MSKYYSIQFAQTYGTGVYGACTYDSSSTTCSTGAGGSSTSTAATTGGLVNTGFMVLVVVTLACLLIFGALIARFWRRSRKLTPEPVKSDDENDRQA